MWSQWGDLSVHPGHHPSGGDGGQGLNTLLQFIYTRMAVAQISQVLELFIELGVVSLKACLIRISLFYESLSESGVLYVQNYKFETWDWYSEKYKVPHLNGLFTKRATRSLLINFGMENMIMALKILNSPILVWGL